MRNKLHIILLAISVLVLQNVQSQDLLRSLDDDSKVKPELLVLFNGTRIAAGHSVETAGIGELKMYIQHRFGDISNGIYDFFGLDLATMRLGFEYGLSDRFTIVLGRNTFEKTYDFALKAKIMSQKEGSIPLSMSLFVGSSINTMKNIYPESNSGFADRQSYTSQVLIARSIGRLSVQLSPTLLYNVYDYRTSASLFYQAIGIGAKVKLTDKVDFTTEYYLGLKELSFGNFNPLSLGIDLDTGGHLFQLVFSNSTGMFEKAFLTNNTGAWSTGNIYFGFNLIRTFYLK